jgi:hypothetical protein
MTHTTHPVTGSTIGCGIALLLAITGCSGGGLPAQDRVDSGDAATPDAPSDAAVDAIVDAAIVRPAVPLNRFAGRVIAFTPGPCAGFGKDRMPGVVQGPPEGGGADQGSLDVVSLGTGGSIVLSFEENAIVDGPGADFLVFENAFNQGGDLQSPFAELAEVSVSEDGVNFKSFRCDRVLFPYGDCAGWRPVYSASSTTLSAVDPAVAGGDPFDLATIGVQRAVFIKIRDLGAQACASGSTINTNGFDLDAIASVHSEKP